jgi:hypothetical protein
MCVLVIRMPVKKLTRYRSYFSNHLDCICLLDPQRRSSVNLCGTLCAQPDSRRPNRSASSCGQFPLE